jgi:hypothetical protein
MKKLYVWGVCPVRHTRITSMNAIKMKTIIKSVGIIWFLAKSATVSAGIINEFNTDTEYAANKFADLQGLEWLTLDVAVGQSRDSIEGGYGGLIDDDWRYATRDETETLLGSLWDQIYSGSSVSNYDGAVWFLNNFGALTTINYHPQFEKLEYSWFLFGAAGDCDPNINLSCEGYVDTRLNPNNIIRAYNVQINDLEITYNPATDSLGTIGTFIEETGVDMGWRPNNATVPNSQITNNESSLLVRVPEPTTFMLVGLGLAGLTFARRKRSHM